MTIFTALIVCLVIILFFIDYRYSIAAAILAFGLFYYNKQSTVCPVSSNEYDELFKKIVYGNISIENAEAYLKSFLRVDMECNIHNMISLKFEVYDKIRELKELIKEILGNQNSPQIKKEFDVSYEN